MWYAVTLLFVYKGYLLCMIYMQNVKEMYVYHIDLKYLVGLFTHNI